MKKEDFARELMLEETKKEKGTFVTQRIIDRLILLYAPLFDRDFLTKLAEIINREGQVRSADSGSSRKPEDLKDMDGLPGPLAAAVNH